MHPLKLVVEGRYWDSYLYQGLLYLFEIEGAVTVVNWDALVREWKVQDTARLALRCAYIRSDYLYGSRWDMLFEDAEVRELIERKFDALARESLIVDRQALSDYVVARTTNRFPFPHNDVTMYDRKMYVTSQAGVFRGGCGKRVTYGISTRPKKLWEAPVHALSGSYGSMAMAAGDDGLFELSTDCAGLTEGDTRNPVRISGRHCSDCDWAFQSILASSHATGGYVAEFAKSPTEDNGFRRELQGISPSNALFNRSGYLWGLQDKVYQYSGGSIRGLRYAPWAEERFADVTLGGDAVGLNAGVLVSAKAAAFGAIVELDDGLQVMRSDGRVEHCKGEPVNWRVFPRSKHYVNQLHVVHSDRIELWSFNHDYFVSQADKQMGVDIGYLLGPSSRA